jgi:uncharacterized membrane protein
MTAEPEDDALAWAGDEPVEAPNTRTVEIVDGPPVPKPMPAVLLITYGILAGVYLIYTIGWVITVTRSTTTLPTLFGEIMFQLGELLAMASPAMWFAAVIVLTRERKPIVRLGLLLVGLVVVIPWPFLLGV